jgi:hypothetical protein
MQYVQCEKNIEVATAPNGRAETTGSRLSPGTQQPQSEQVAETEGMWARVLTWITLALAMALLLG